MLQTPNNDTLSRVPVPRDDAPSCARLQRAAVRAARFRHVHAHTHPAQGSGREHQDAQGFASCLHQPQ